MSDFAWIALVIIVYMVVIKPMMQGILNQPAKGQPSSPKSQGAPKQPKQGKEGDYVDYEEIK